MENLPPNEVLKNLKKKADDKAKWRRVNHARYTMYVIASLLLISTGVMWYANMNPQQNAEIVLYVMFGLAAVYIALGLWSRKYPKPALISAITLYSLVIVMAGFGDPSTILEGLLWKILVLGLFIRGLVSVKYINTEEKNDEVLDDFG